MFTLATDAPAAAYARAGRFVAATQLFAGAGALAPDVGSASMSRWNGWRDRHLRMLRHKLSRTSSPLSGPRGSGWTWTSSSRRPS